MSYVSVQIDVTHSLPADVVDRASITIAAWIFPPHPAGCLFVPSTIVLLNGGTYDKR
jgi:hypothetical protein